jgi:mannose-6-phosphate isomerase-like protein (cupin superfamily)
MRKIDKPWGYEVVWAETDRYVGKVLHINHGYSLSLQYHRVKEETLLVKTGTLTLQLGRNESMKILKLKSGDVQHIVPGLIHRMSAEDGDVEIVEVSTPELDDVVRLEDRYGRI